MTETTIQSLYRYPLKGFSAEPLERVSVAVGQRIAGDRTFAVENGTRDFDPFEPVHFFKTKFLQLMQFERVATLTTTFDHETGVLRIEKDGKSLVQGDLTTPTGRQIVEQFLAAYFKEELKGPPRIVHAEGHAFTDVDAPYVSLINLASVRDLERVVGAPVDPLRFRGNIYFDGGEPWIEKKWIDKTIRIGEAEAFVAKGIVRCAATNVDPAEAKRDMQLPRTLAKVFGQNEMGIYVDVTKAGAIATGDTISLAS